MSTPISAVATFHQLSNEIREYVSPVKELAVIDSESGVAAQSVAKQIKSYLDQVEVKMRRLTDPLDAEKKAIFAYVKELTAPLLEAKAHVQNELNKFAARQEVLKQAELKRIDEERKEKQRQMVADIEAERERIRIEEEKKPKIDAETAAKFGIEQEPSKLDHFDATASVALAVQKVEYDQAAYDAKQIQVKGATKRWKVEVIDIAQVPPMYLNVSLNESMVLAQARACLPTKPLTIPGLKIFQEISVAIGGRR